MTIKKQYKRLYPNGKCINYIKFDDFVLTSDGIVLSNDELLTISYDDYINKVISTQLKYNYEASIRNNQLIYDIKEMPSETSEKEDVITDKVEFPTFNIQSEIKNIKPKKVQKKIKKIDFLTLVLDSIVVSCSILSIYFTATYLTKLQNIFIGYLISFSMLMYGLISSQITRESFRNKKYLRGSLFLITSVITLGFSMFTSLDVNMCRYYAMNESRNIAEVDKRKNTKQFELLEQELSDNKIQIANLNKDIEIQQKQYVLSWDSNLGKNVIIEGKISSSAQDKINKDNELIIKLQDRNKEINKLLIDLVDDGLTDTENENKAENTKSLTELLGVLTNLGGNTVQMLILIFPSFMIDGINVLALTILTIKKEKKKKR